MSIKHSWLANLEAIAENTITGSGKERQLTPPFPDEMDAIAKDRLAIQYEGIWYLSIKGYILLVQTMRKQIGILQAKNKELQASDDAARWAGMGPYNHP